jgi:hypothetical protein
MSTKISASTDRNDAIQAILDLCPRAGGGVNLWLFRTALKLHRLNIEPMKIEELLEEATTDCGRNLKRDEIPRAVRNSNSQKKRIYKPQRAWPFRNLEQIEAVGLDGFRIANLEANSPVKPSAVKQTEMIIDALFRGNPLLCAGDTTEDARTRTREEWRGWLGWKQFIVPSPMSKRQGINLEGKISARCLDNTGPRKFLVIEFDFVEKDEKGRDTEIAPVLRRLAEHRIGISDLCAALHAELAKLRPLGLVVHSGGKSVHGWYPCNGDEENVMRRFMRFAVSLGADPATWTRCQLVRMPDGLRRQNGKRQRVLYFNPVVLNGGAK